MDQTRPSILRFFDDVLAVLNTHHEENGATEALEYLKAARYNYEQHDIDRLLTSFVLALQQVPRLRPEVMREIQKVIREFTDLRSETAAKMIRMAQDYESRGGKLLSLSEVLEEVSRRRGSPE
jgi:predicted metal-dependent hydrolase